MNAGNLMGKFTLILYCLVLLIVVLKYFLCFCFDLGSYLPWDFAQMQRLYTRKC